MAGLTARPVGWKPTHYINNVSSSVGTVMKPAGLDNSQGIITALYLKDPARRAVLDADHSVPDVRLERGRVQDRRGPAHDVAVLKDCKFFNRHASKGLKRRGLVCVRAQTNK